MRIAADSALVKRLFSRLAQQVRQFGKIRRDPRGASSRASSAVFSVTGVTALVADSDLWWVSLGAGHANRFGRGIRTKAQGASTKANRYYDGVGLVCHLPRDACDAIY